MQHSTTQLLRGQLLARLLLHLQQQVISGQCRALQLGGQHDLVHPAGASMSAQVSGHIADVCSGLQWWLTQLLLPASLHSAPCQVGQGTDIMSAPATLW